MKILIAEDDAMLLKTIELHLLKKGYEVIATRDGREAMAKIDEVLPDMVITDVMMPWISGMQIIEKVKNRTDRQIPVIVLSVIDQEAVVMQALELGADDYMTKPFSLKELSTRIKRLL
jgi:DNA-binding response OmpR family regulator